jgi:dTMP kinase
MPLVVFEGIDGCGKSTQQRLLIARLRESGLSVQTWREPGGTEIGERIRGLLLDPATMMCPAAEVFAYQLARAQLVHDCIAPALRRGDWVVLDRFWYSTIAYQAHALGLGVETIQATMPLALGGVQTDRVFWLRLDPREAQRRRAGETDDRIEMRGLAYQQKVDEGYARQAEQDAAFVALDADQPIEALAEQIWSSCTELL